MMRFSCILFTIYFYWCKLYRSRSKALYVGLFRAIPSYTLLMQAEMPQIRAVHRRRVSLCLDRDSHAGIDARAGNYAPESKRLLESDCSTLSLNRALCGTPLLRQAEMPQIRVVAVIRVNPIRLTYGRLVCHKRSLPWQSIGRDSRMRPMSNSAGCPDAMDPERGSVGSGAVVALYRTVAGRVPVWKCRAGTFWGNQGLTGALRFRWLLPSLTALFRAAALGVRRCIGYYLRKRSCRHTAAYGSLSLSVCVATLPYSGSTHRHSQGLQCFLSRSPTLSGSFQKNLKPS